MRKVKTYSSAKKLAVVKDLLKGDKTFSQVCIKHGIAKSTIKGWQKQFKDNGHMIFEISKSKKVNPKESPEYLKTIIGGQAIEIDVLKKALSIWD